ncbi:hypothetical protein [Streptococcus marimammalium]
MENTNLNTFDNIYANLAQSAYTERPRSFSDYSTSKKSISFNYSLNHIDEESKQITKGGQNLPNNGIVYLQPDKTVKTYSLVNGHPSVVSDKYKGTEGTFQKGLLIDEAAGYNAYFLTDTDKLSQETQKTFLAVRGSDGMVRLFRSFYFA